MRFVSKPDIFFFVVIFSEFLAFFDLQFFSRFFCVFFSGLFF